MEWELITPLLWIVMIFLFIAEYILNAPFIVLVYILVLPVLIGTAYFVISKIESIVKKEG